MPGNLPTAARPSRHRLPTWLAGVLAAALMLFGPLASTPAQAVPGVPDGACPTPTTQDAFIADPDCTTSSIVNVHAIPGGGSRLLTPQDLLVNEEYYARQGFSREWILSAPRIQVPVSSSTVWNGCRSGQNTTGACPEDQVVRVPMTVVLSAGTVTDPVLIDVIGTPDKWIALMCGNFVMQADLEKVALFVVDAPQTIPADTDVPITVRSVLRNNGPSDPVPGHDQVTVTAQSPDCTITPASRSTTISLPAGRETVWDAAFTVRCTEPSNHSITFTNVLTTDAGFQESNPGNQTAVHAWAPAVIDRSDIAVSDPRFTCDPRTMVGEDFTCTGSATIANLGPHGPEPVRSTLVPVLREDCRIIGSTNATLDRTLASGESARHEAGWTVRCEQRSFHELGLTAEATLFGADPHVIDPDDDNNRVATPKVITEVFETVDLETQVLDLQCTEREHNTLASACTALVRITNNGPADKVITDTDIRFDVEDTCTAASPAQTGQHTLAAGTSQDLRFTTEITCTTDRRHIADVAATLHNAPSDPHAVDTDTDTLRWVPSDIKPRSLPSSVNVNKEGVVPLAILATAEFDPLTEVDRASLTFGVTGTENSAVTCKPTGEDVNDDGRLDLICQAQTQLTGVACDTSEMAIHGLLTDGRRFVSQDAVNVVGCRR